MNAIGLETSRNARSPEARSVQSNAKQPRCECTLSREGTTEMLPSFARLPQDLHLCLRFNVSLSFFTSARNAAARAWNGKGAGAALDECTTGVMTVS